jgi:hypothetical protein
MPNGSQSEEDRKLKLSQAAFVLFFVVSIGTVLHFLYKLSPPLDFSQSRPSAIEIRLREEMEATWKVAGLPVPNCGRLPKLVGISCLVPEQGIQQVVETLKLGGWREDYVSGSSFAMRREKDSLSWSCTHQSSTGLCEFKLWYNLR